VLAVESDDDSEVDVLIDLQFSGELFPEPESVILIQ